MTFGDYKEAYRSVINFGIRQVYGRLAPDIEEIEKQLFDALVTFEPRINRHTLKVHGEDRAEYPFDRIDGRAVGKSVTGEAVHQDGARSGVECV